MLEAFPAVVVAPCLSDGFESLVHCQGMGSLRANTVMIRWPNDSDRAESFAATLRTITSLHRGIVTIKFRGKTADPRVAPKGTIYVWWRGRQNGSLMMLLAYLLTKNTAWRNRSIRLMPAIESDAGKLEFERHSRELAEEDRINVTVLAVVASDAK